ncbi:NosD domain-containing protein [Hyphococcus sp.]|uniref:NosD domain-containing protein n=1 Tax=Hyphococcus sp. TaxID=2038636 RepID=UPI003D10CC5F
MKNFFIIIVAFMTFCGGCAGPAAAEISVSDAAALEKAVAKARKGETILLAPGQYDLTDLKIPRDLTLKGEGEVVFYTTRPTEKGILNPLWDASLRVENIRFKGARAPDFNGAGIRHDGMDLTVINCIFDTNEDGILATGQDEGVVTISGSAFINNGYGDGYSHGIYMASGRSLTITESRFTGTRIGHHVKSLAAVTKITGSNFDDADGKTSYSIDASKGGNVVITGNSFIQAADGDNSTLINYDQTRGGGADALVISGNRIVNRNRNGRLLRNGTALVPIIEDNEITNEAGGRLSVK